MTRVRTLLSFRDLQVAFPEVQGRDMTSLLLPGAVEVVRQDVDEVEVSRESRHVVGAVDGIAGGRHRRREQQRRRLGVEGRLQLLQEERDRHETELLLLTETLARSVSYWRCKAYDTSSGMGQPFLDTLSALSSI